MGIQQLGYCFSGGEDWKWDVITKDWWDSKAEKLIPCESSNGSPKERFFAVFHIWSTRFGSMGLLSEPKIFPGGKLKNMADGIKIMNWKLKFRQARVAFYRALVFLTLVSIPMTEHTLTHPQNCILLHQEGMCMGTDADSQTKCPDLVKTFRKGDCNPILLSQVKLFDDNACLRREIDDIYDILFKRFEEEIQRVTMTRPKKMVIPCHMIHWMGNLQDWSEYWVPRIRTWCIVKPTTIVLDKFWSRAGCFYVECIAIIF